MAAVRSREWEEIDEPNAKRLKKNGSAFVKAFTVEDQVMVDVAADIPEAEAEAEAAAEPAVAAESEVNCLATGWVQVKKAVDVIWLWVFGGTAAEAYEAAE